MEQRITERFVVHFFDMENMTQDAWGYGDLLSAMRAVKAFEVDGKQLISDEQFDEELITLLTTGLISTLGYSIKLLRADGNVVYGPDIVPFVAGSVTPNRRSALVQQREGKIQRSGNADILPVAEVSHPEFDSLRFKDRMTKAFSPVADDVILGIIKTDPPVAED